jgi:hypothetical protein
MVEARYGVRTNGLHKDNLRLDLNDCVASFEGKLGTNFASGNFGLSFRWYSEAEEAM